MVLKLRIRYMTMESESDESAGIERIGSETQFCLAEACLVDYLSVIICIILY